MILNAIKQGGKVNKRTLKTFHSVEENEKEQKKRAWLPTQFHCFFDCLARIDGKKYKTVPCPSHSHHPASSNLGGFPVVSVLPNDGFEKDVTSAIDDQDLLKTFQEETSFDVAKWDTEDVQDACTDELSDYFSVCPADIDCESTYSNFDIFLNRRSSIYSSFNSDIECIKDDDSVNRLENILLQEVSGWVPFDSVSFSPTRKSRSSKKPVSPRTPTPTEKNSQVESQGTPATENTAGSYSDTDSTHGRVDDMFVSVSVPSLSDFDDDVSFCYGYCDESSVYDYSLSNGTTDLSLDPESDSLLRASDAQKTSATSLENFDEMVHDPPKPNRHRLKINRFLERNEMSQTFSGDSFQQKECILHYLQTFRPYDSVEENDVSDSESCLSIGTKSVTHEKIIYHDSLEDIGSHNYEFDRLYHSSMSSI